MSEFEEILEEIHSNCSHIQFILHIDGMEVPLDEPIIKKVKTPVSRPVERGGVYYSDVFVFKIIGKTQKMEVIPLLSKVMLGPNKEFGKLRVKTDHVDKNDKQIELVCHVTNSMQSGKTVEMHLVIDDVVT